MVEATDICATHQAVLASAVAISSIVLDVVQRS